MKLKNPTPKNWSSSLLALFLALAAPVVALPGAEEVTEIFKDRREKNRTAWKQELLAQEYETAFINLWDELRESDDALPVFEGFSFESLKLGPLGEAKRHGYGIEARKMQSHDRSISWEEWMALLKDYQKRGFRLAQSEWHHKRFVEETDGYRSKVSMTLHVLDESSDTRYILDGMLKVDWKTERNFRGVFMPKTIAIDSLEVLKRQGPPLFAKLGTFEIGPGKRGPILQYDLNSDGGAEIVMPAAGQIAWHDAQAGYRIAPLGPVDVQSARSAVIGDFTGNGHPDLVFDGSIQGSSKGESGFFLMEGSSSGAFKRRPVRLAIEPNIRIQGDTTITAGDVDGDGNLDLFVGQYKEPYLEGSMPTPYYDSNDGYPSYLLINQGGGIRFKEETEKRGIAEKRLRRVYSTSLVDYDQDGDMDLVVVADFAGVDLYENFGGGHFKDVSNEALGKRHLFGMAHSFGDHNHDGRLDMYAIGMSSTTARRLHAMGASRQEFEELADMRMPMTYGNRLYFGQADGFFTQPPLSDQIARTGWSWGVATADFDNGLRPWVYVANGHDSKSTARDYCSAYWTDDIYRSQPQEDPVMAEYFDLKLTEKDQEGISWNGFEKNFLFMPTEDGGYCNVSFLGDVAIERDSRMVISDDVNLDGKPDLLVEYQPNNYDPKKDKTWLAVFANNVPTRHNWIGVRLKEEAEAPSPIGASVTLVSDGKKRVSSIVTGDSFESQRPAVAHFGLGDGEQVDAVQIKWLDGTTTTLENPDINQYHWVTPQHSTAVAER